MYWLAKDATNDVQGSGATISGSDRKANIFLEKEFNSWKELKSKQNLCCPTVVGWCNLFCAGRLVYCIGDVGMSFIMMSKMISWCTMRPVLENWFQASMFGHWARKYDSRFEGNVKETARRERQKEHIFSEHPSNTCPQGRSNTPHWALHVKADIGKEHCWKQRNLVVVGRHHSKRPQSKIRWRRLKSSYQTRCLR